MLHLEINIQTLHFCKSEYILLCVCASFTRGQVMCDDLVEKNKVFKTSILKFGGLYFVPERSC